MLHCNFSDNKARIDDTQMKTCIPDLSGQLGYLWDKRSLGVTLFKGVLVLLMFCLACSSARLYLYHTRWFSGCSVMAHECILRLLKTSHGSGLV